MPRFKLLIPEPGVPPVNFPMSRASEQQEDFKNMKSSKRKERTDIERKKLSAMIRPRTPHGRRTYSE